MSSLKPFFTFYGGKYRAAPRYPAPVYRIIIEPFAGAAGYSMRHYARSVVLCDKDPNVTWTWRYLTRVSEEEILSLPDIEPGQTVDDLRITQEAKILIGWWLNKGVASPRKAPSAWMRQGHHPNSFWGPAIRERIATQVSLIRHWQIFEGDYSILPDVEATWFVDPPYRAAGKYYRCQPESFGDLATWCRARRGQVMVCENVGADWLPFRPHLDSKANESRRGGKISREAIWEKGIDP